MTQLDPESFDEEAWIAASRERIAAYLKGQRVDHGRIGEVPAWSVPPSVAIYAIESVRAPGWVGWWVLQSDDSLIDYCSRDDAREPREVLIAIGKRWIDAAACMARGEHHPEVRYGAPEQFPALAQALGRRAELFAKWIDDESLWEET